VKNPPTVMTVEEVAIYLRIPRSSVYKLAQEGRIPCKKAGRRWRFHRKAIDDWLSDARRHASARRSGYRQDDRALRGIAQRMEDEGPQ
jgi:excisionase family DNA binding protein